jgi:hypothetical protein
VAVLSEQEVTKLVGLHPKDLKLSAATLTNEEGSTMTGYCLSLKEMPLPEVFACRKLRLSRAVKVERERKQIQLGLPFSSLPLMVPSTSVLPGLMKYTL